MRENRTASDDNVTRGSDTAGTGALGDLPGIRDWARIVVPAEPIRRLAGALSANHLPPLTWLDVFGLTILVVEQHLHAHLPRERPLGDHFWMRLLKAVVTTVNATPDIASRAGALTDVHLVGTGRSSHAARRACDVFCRWYEETSAQCRRWDEAPWPGESRAPRLCQLLGAILAIANTARIEEIAGDLEHALRLAKKRASGTDDLTQEERTLEHLLAALGHAYEIENDGGSVIYLGNEGRYRLGARQLRDHMAAEFKQVAPGRRIDELELDGFACREAADALAAVETTKSGQAIRGVVEAVEVVRRERLARAKPGTGRAHVLEHLWPLVRREVTPEAVGRAVGMTARNIRYHLEKEKDAVRQDSRVRRAGGI